MSCAIVWIVTCLLGVISFVAIISKFIGGHWAFGPFGLLVMLANVPYETVMKKIRMSRITADSLTFFGLSLLWTGIWGYEAGLLFALIFGGMWVYSLHVDALAVRGNPGEQDKRYVGAIPMPHPKLLVTLKGPVWAWTKQGFDLGDWPQGRSVKYELQVLNPTILEPQVKTRIAIRLLRGKIAIEGGNGDYDTPRPGEVLTVPFSLHSDGCSGGETKLQIAVETSTYCIQKTLRIRSIFDPDKHAITRAEINRWQGGALAGFAWRGDMDMYDPCTFQSVEGLRWVLDICARFRIASTMFLSGRLSINKEEHKKHTDHLQIDRQTEGIDGFIRFMKEEVTLGHKLDFPYTTERRYAMELGNHMYLHYGTHAAMAEENGWKNRCRMLAGRYAWQSSDEGSFAEQRDNVKKNMEVMRETFHYEMKTWGVPGRDYDEETPRAVEAGGMVVGSDTNASAFINVLRLPPPHHPNGCQHLVELTKKYPGDPDNMYKIGMLKYWMWWATVKRATFIYMAHHHVLKYEGQACTGMTEYILRYALEKGGLYFISTMYGLGIYWEKVLCPQHRCVSVETEGARIKVMNTDKEALSDIPVEIHFKGGKRMVLITDLPAGQLTQMSLVRG